MDNSYRSPYTDQIKPFVAYKRDFKNAGQFYEETFGLETKLISSVYPGRYIGQQWIAAEPGHYLDNAYTINLHYLNKYQVDVEIKVKNYHLHTAEVIKLTACKFFLVNQLFSGESPIKVPGGEATWDDVEKLIAAAITINSPEYRDSANSWQKVMTLKEAKQLMEFLKIEVQFPS